MLKNAAAVPMSGTLGRGVTPRVSTRRSGPASPSGFTLTRDEKSALFVCALCGILGLLLQYPPVKVVAAVLLAITFLRVSFRHYHLAVGLFVFFVPLQEVAGTTSFLVPGLNLQTAFVLFFTSLAIAQRAPRVSAPAQGQERTRNPVTMPLALLLTIIVLSACHSALVSHQPLWNLLTTIKNGFIYCAFFWLCFSKIREGRSKLVVVLFVFLSVMFNVVISLRNVFDTLSSALIFLRHRAASLITDQPNLYGGFLALYLFYFVAFLLYYPMPKRQRVVLGVCTGLVALNLLYTLSRGAWLAAALVTGILVVTKSRRMLIPLAIFLVAILAAAPDVVVDRWQSTVDSNEYSLSHLTADETDIDEAASRIIQWRTFPSMLMLNPLLGIGKGNYAGTHYALGNDVMVRSPHSSIIAIGVEEGIFGLICYLWLLIVIYRSAAKLFRTAQDPIDTALSFGTMAATLCLFFLDFTGTRFFAGSIMAYYWILTGITLNVDPASLRSPQRRDVLRAANGPASASTTVPPRSVRV